MKLWNKNTIWNTINYENTHTFIIAIYIYIYTHYLANSIPPESPAVFICNNIQTLVYDAFLLFPIQKRDRSRGWVQHALHESPVYDRRELIIKTCLHFRPVAVILNWVYLMFFLASKDYSRVSSSTTSFSSQRRAFVPPRPKLNVRIRSIVCRLL